MIKRLSLRKLEVLQMLCEGASEKQIAQALKLTPATVHEYIKTIYRFYQVESRAELLVKVITADFALRLDRIVQAIVREFPSLPNYRVVIVHTPPNPPS